VLTFWVVVAEADSGNTGGLATTEAGDQWRAQHIGALVEGGLTAAVRDPSDKLPRLCSGRIVPLITAFLPRLTFPFVPCFPLTCTFVPP